MTTPILVGLGAIAAALTGRHLIRNGLLAGRGAAEQWVKGGFKAKIDRKEAIAILGLKYVQPFNVFAVILTHALQGWPNAADTAEGCTSAHHAHESSGSRGLAIPG